MTDPFEALAAPVIPQPPDPAFTAALRARLQRALLATQGMTTGESMTTQTGTDAGTPTLAEQHSSRPISRWRTRARPSIGTRVSSQPSRTVSPT